MAAINQNQHTMIDDGDDAQSEQLIAKIEAMSEDERWSRRDELDCALNKYGYIEWARIELDLIEDRLVTWKNRT